MRNKLICSICKCNNIYKINGYKHNFYYCSNCKSIEAKRKGKSSFFAITISKLLPTERKGKLIFNNGFLENKKAIYDYYKDIKSINNTNWQGEYEELIKFALDANITFYNKDIIEISGGPGFVALELQKIAKSLILTEFSNIAVKGIEENTGVKCIQFDYFIDEIDKIIPDKKFDIVLIRNNINFCKDLENFVRTIKNIISERGYVYIDHTISTAGVLIRHQFEDYPFVILYSPQIIKEVFALFGFKEIYIKSISNKIIVDYHPNFGKRKFFASFYYLLLKLIQQYYKLLIKLSIRPINKDFTIKRYVQIFKLIKE